MVMVWGIMIMQTRRNRCDLDHRAMVFQGIAQNAFNDILSKHINSGKIKVGDKLAKKLVSGNLGYAEYSLVNPNTIKEEYRSKYGKTGSFIAHSQVSNKIENNDFDFMKHDFVPEGTGKFKLRVNTQREIGLGSMERQRDSESKIIEKLIEIFDSNFTDNKGTVELYTYREPCLSCDNHFIEFSRLFPQIILTIYYEIPYNEV